MFGSKDLLFSSEQYGVAKSLRFRSGSSTYLNRTPNSTSNQQKLTFSFWVKPGALTVTRDLLTAGSASSNFFYFAFNGSNSLTLQCITGSSEVARFSTPAVFRDPSAWYHVVLSIDMTQATNSNGIKLYVNGAQQTLTFVSYTQNANLYINVSSVVHYIGRASLSAAEYFDGYMAEVNFVDGQALTPTSFGFYDNNGIWQPKGYTGTYGTNGFYLKFTDVGATSGANSGYGKDFSGFNTNYWTTNNFGTTSTATTYDSMYDSPVNASNGITGIGNYCVLNPLNTSGGTISNANLTLTASSSSVGNMILGSVGSDSLKYYFEVTVTKPDNGYLVAGVQNIANAPYATLVIASTPSYQWVWRDDGTRANNGAASAYGSALSNGGTVAVAVDPAGGKIWWGSASSGTVTWFGSPAGDPTAGTNAAYSNLSGVVAPCVGTEGWVTAASVGNFNAGQRPFVGAIPSGFSALNTQNLSTPTITNGAAYMAATTYTGNASSRSITNGSNNNAGTTFQPDFVWIKSRSNALNSGLMDSVRGPTKLLISNATNAEQTFTDELTSFNVDGFSLGASANGYTNYNNYTYVAWQWKAGGTGVSNTSGSITSTVSANTSAGFSVVTYTGTGANATVGHGLGVAPSMVIVKDRDSSTNGGAVYHTSLGATKYLKLFQTAAATPPPSGTDAEAIDNTIWNGGSPTFNSSVFSIGTNARTNSTDRYVAYCFAPVAGYSAFGSYTGNGSTTDGPFIYTGFRPRWIMFKASSTTGSWNLQDTSRDTYNLAIAGLYADLSQAEDTSRTTDILSNGFKFRGTAGNVSGTTYIYAAFAENPFKISRAR